MPAAACRRFSRATERVLCQSAPALRVAATPPPAAALLQWRSAESMSAAAPPHTLDLLHCPDLLARVYTYLLT